MSKETKRQAYSLMTAISMIIGIVIGSGIYFKADDILSFAGGNLFLALLSMVIASSSIIFGALSLSELAQRTSDSGGVANYIEKFISPSLGSAYGFFLAYVYYPSVSAIVAWVAALYSSQVIGIDLSLEGQIVLAIVYLTLLAFLNLYSRQLAGLFQSLSTTIKVIPLILVAAIGLFWSGSTPDIPANYEVVPVTNVGWGWLSALVPLAFAYDGWTAVTSIAPEIKNPKKNLPRALVTGPVLILILYLLYIYGLSHVLGESYVMSVGNDAAQHFISMIFNPGITRLFMLIIVISVLGVSNGFMLSGMRLPQAYAERGWFGGKKVATIDERYQLSVASSFLVYGTTLVWLLVHYVLTKTSFLPNSDISEIAIVFNSLVLVILYLTVLKLYRQGVITSRLTGLVSPILAILGVAMLLIGSLLTSFWQVLAFMLLCLLSCLIGFALFKKNN